MHSSELLVRSKKGPLVFRGCIGGINNDEPIFTFFCAHDDSQRGFVMAPRQARRTLSSAELHSVCSPPSHSPTKPPPPHPPLCPSRCPVGFPLLLCEAGGAGVVGPFWCGYINLPNLDLPNLGCKWWVVEHECTRVLEPTAADTCQANGKQQGTGLADQRRVDLNCRTEGHNCGKPRHETIQRP